jgi:hypothetical protein
MTYLARENDTGVDRLDLHDRSLKVETRVRTPLGLLIGLNPV